MRLKRSLLLKTFFQLLLMQTISQAQRRCLSSEAFGLEKLGFQFTMQVGLNERLLITGEIANGKVRDQTPDKLLLNKSTGAIMERRQIQLGFCEPKGSKTIA